MMSSNRLLLPLFSLGALALLAFNSVRKSFLATSFLGRRSDLASSSLRSIVSTIGAVELLLNPILRLGLLLAISGGIGKSRGNPPKLSRTEGGFAGGQLSLDLFWLVGLVEVEFIPNPL